MQANFAGHWNSTCWFNHLLEGCSGCGAKKYFPATTLLPSPKQLRSLYCVKCQICVWPSDKLDGIVKVAWYDGHLQSCSCRADGPDEFARTVSRPSRQMRVYREAVSAHTHFWWEESTLKGHTMLSPSCSHCILLRGTTSVACVARGCADAETTAKVAGGESGR